MSDFTGVFPSQAGDPAGQLEELWRRGQRPAVEPFLTRIGHLAPGQLVAVLRVDQYWRWQAGERVLAEVYLEQHAARLTDLEDVLELIYGEYLLREELGESPKLDGFHSEQRRAASPSVCLRSRRARPSGSRPARLRARHLERIPACRRRVRRTV